MSINNIECLIIKLNHLLNILDSMLPYDTLWNMGFAKEQRNAEVMAACDALGKISHYEKLLGELIEIDTKKTRF